MALPLIPLPYHEEEETLTDAEFELEILRHMHMDTDALFDKKSLKKAVKDAADKVVKKTKSGAKELAAKAKRMKAGSILPGSWRDETTSYEFVARRLTRSYRNNFGAEHLEQVRAEIYPDGLMVTAESGLMVTASMRFFSDRVVIILMDSGSTWAVDGVVYINADESFDHLANEIDESLKALAKKFKKLARPLTEE